MMATRLRKLLMVCAVCSACGGGSPMSPPPPPSPNPNVITISSAGVVSPKDLIVSQGAQVLFVNNHSRRHDMASDDHPDHLECPALNVGPVNPGQRKESENLIAIRTCGFHDHEDAENVNLQGRVVVR